MNFFLNARTVVAAGLLLAPFPTAANEAFQLRLLGDFSLFNQTQDLKEPSGLAMDPGTQRLWTVSDNVETIYLLDLDGDLKDLKSLEVEADDLEGIAFRPDGSIVAVREKSNEILVIDRNDGRTIERKRLSEVSGYNEIKQDFDEGPSGKGLEGLTIDPSTGILYALKEGRPRLMLEISANLSEIIEVHHLTMDAGFHVKDVSDKKLDVSGIAHDDSRGGFWIISDAGRTVFFYDAQSRSAVGHALFHRDGVDLKPLKNAEGVALNSAGNILFIATDDEDDSLIVSFELLMLDE